MIFPQKIQSVTRLVSRAVFCVFALLTGGVLFAYFSDALGFFASFIWKKWDAVRVRQIAWVVGVVFTAIGIPLGWVKVTFNVPRDTPPAPKTEAPEPIAATAPSRKATDILKATAGLAIGGAMLGVILGGFLALAWFSISVSPFAPESWSHSIESSTRDVTNPTMDPGAGFSTTNPLLLRLMLVPPVVLAVLGALTGLICGIIERVSQRQTSGS